MARRTPERLNKSVAPLALRNRLAKIHVLNRGEVEKLFTVITNLRDQALFPLAYRHGLRASEVSLLEIGDVNFAKTKINIRRLTSKLTSSHDMQKDESAALKRYLKSRTDNSVILFLNAHGKPITRRGLDWLMKSYGKQAKLPTRKRHFHVLKHSITTHLLGAGADLRFVHEWLGHTLLQSTAIYLYLVSPGASGKMPEIKLPKLS